MSNEQDKPPFEQMIPLAVIEINKWRNGWTLSSLAFEDVSQILLLHAFNKYYQFEPSKGEFTHWVNRMISNRMKNILRDNLQKFSRPCVQGCQFNLGDNSCGYTESKTQCSECPLYAKWKKKKEAEYNIKQGLSLDSHVQEINNIQSDFTDIDQYKRMLGEKLPNYLTVQEFRIYRLLFEEHKTEREVGEILKFAKAKNDGVPGYQTIHKAKIKIIKMAKKVIFEEGI
jgi:DNA-directed RNA polymerase specialized sigma subunit